MAKPKTTPLPDITDLEKFGKAWELFAEALW